MRGSFLVYTLIDAKLSDNMSAHHRDAFSFQSLSHYWFIFQISNENASPSWAVFVFLFFCSYKTRKSLLRLPPWARSKPPGYILSGRVALPAVLLKVHLWERISRTTYTTLPNRLQSGPKLPS